LAEGKEIKEQVVGNVPFGKINSILEGKLERGEAERRNVVREVEEKNNQVITGGGKRFRVALPYIMARGLDLDYSDEELVEAFLPIEMAHGLSLVMDDMIDEDKKRRGMKTPHERLKQEGYTEKQAESLVTLDVMQILSRAERAPFELDFLTRDQQIEITEAIGEGITRLTRGQELDVAGENSMEEGFQEKISYSGKEFSYEVFYRDVVEGKTSPLFEAGPRILEIISEEDLENLQQYTKNLAKAFQIRDDILDISAGEEEISVSERPEEDGIGKDRYSDISEGTMTLPINYAFQLMEEDGWKDMEAYVEELVDSENYLGSVDDFFEVYGDRREFLESVMEKDSPESYELQIAGKIIESTGALEKANEEALSYAESAVENLDNSEIEGEYEELLEDMAYFAATRSK
jgi:geranylgeranyl diphosphate synthase type I